MKTQSHAAAVELLYENIHALPHDEYGVINFLPFAHDSEQVREVKRHTCEAIVALLETNGLLETQASQEQPQSSADVKCRNCGKQFLHLPLGADGVGVVDARAFITNVAQLNQECPHDPVTLDDHRRRMEREFTDWDDSEMGE